MNYAWEHPVTGLRQQTPRPQKPNDSAELFRLRQFARRALWEQLQSADELEPSHEAKFYAQVDAGRVDASGDHVELDSIPGFDPQSARFAWCGPIDGKRYRSETWPSHLQDEIIQLSARGEDPIQIGRAHV